MQNGAQSADTFKSLYKSQTEIVVDESATDPDRILQSIVDLCRILRMPETRLQTVTDNIKDQSHEQRIAYYKQLLDHHAERFLPFAPPLWEISASTDFKFNLKFREYDHEEVWERYFTEPIDSSIFENLSSFDYIIDPNQEL